MKSLYFDCFAGASGNMILGALVALGVDEKELIEQIKLLDVADFEIQFQTMDKSGISAIHAEVKYPPEHAHRHLHDIEKIINDSRLKDSIKKRAIAIFTKLAEAEAKVHGTSVEKIHFHEVGAMDAIVDVVGACVGFEILGIEKFYCSKIHTGSGFVKMAHGKFPIPPPAVAEILQSVNAPVYQTEIEGELITPTGAAIIATVCEEFGMLPDLKKLEKTAYGAGTRDYKDFPNVLRLILGELEQGQYTFYTPDWDEVRNPKKVMMEEYQEVMKALSNFVEADNEKEKINNTKSEPLLLLETNIDDLSPEILGFVMERAFELGALDCWFTPIQMKKNRPATMLSVLCDEKSVEIIKELIFTETTTLGVRIREIKRECLPREIVEIDTEYGSVRIKIARFKNKIVNAKPEYDQIREIALKSNKSLREIKKEIEDLITTKLKL